MRYIIPWNFEIQTDHQILAKRPDLMIINKKKKKKKKKDNQLNCGLSNPGESQSNKSKRMKRKTSK